MEQDSHPEAYCVHVWIQEIHPMLWRRFLVRSDSTLADVHVVLQIGFDWTDFHLHRFRIRKKDYAVPRLGGHACHDARKCNESLSLAPGRSLSQAGLGAVCLVRPSFWNGIRPRVTSATAPTSAWRAGGYAGDRCGYVATQDFRGEFRECEFPLEELEALEKILKAIPIPLGSSVGAFDGGSGLIRIYHGCEGWIDFFYRSIEQPQWDALLEFIRQTSERFFPSPPSEMHGNFFDDPLPEEPVLAQCSDEEL